MPGDYPRGLRARGIFTTDASRGGEKYVRVWHSEHKRQDSAAKWTGIKGYGRMDRLSFS